MATVQGLASILNPRGAMDPRPIRTREAESLPSEGTPPAEREEILEAAREFESLLLNMMLQAMRATVPKTGPWSESHEMNMYEELRDEETAKAMARSGGIGLAPLIARQLGGDEEGLELLNSALASARAAGHRVRALAAAPEAATGAAGFTTGEPERIDVEPDTELRLVPAVSGEPGKEES